MMYRQKKLSARLYDAIFPPKPGRKGSRTYAAAKTNRLNAGWSSSPTGANYESRISLAALIARSRQAARDDLHIVNYLRLMRANIIGQKGIQLQCRAMAADRKTLNSELNKTVENAWWEWTHAETCTVSGKLGWKDVQDLAVTQCERDGAFLIEMIEADNAFGFSLRVWDICWLDLNYNVGGQMNSSNRIIQSVEVDVNDKPVAYWFTPPPNEFEFLNRQQQERRRIRVSADQIIHGSRIFDDESQVHGIPGTAAALLPCKNAYSYEESVIMASRASVNQFAVLKNTSPDGEGQFTGQEDSDGNLQNPMIDSSPLAITQLLPGWEMQQFKPEHPTQNHPAFAQSLDMKIAASLGVPYFLLMGDWTAVNFSSSRGGLGEFRERCKSYQAFISTTLCRRVFHKWLEAAWLNGKIKMTAKEYLELQNPEWIPRGFDYVDPEKDVTTSMISIAGGLSTYTKELAAQGQDFAEFLMEKKSEQEQMDAIGVQLTPVTSIKVTDTGTAPTDISGPPAKDTAKPARGYLNGRDTDLPLID